MVTGTDTEAAAAPEVAPPPVAPKTAEGPAGDIKPPPTEAGQKVEVPVQAVGGEQPDPVAKVRAEVADTEMPPGKEVTPGEPLKVIDGDSKQAARDAVAGSREEGKHEDLEARVSPDPGEEKPAVIPTAVQVQAPPVGTPVAEEPTPTLTEDGVLAGLDENAEPSQPEPQPASEPTAPAQPPVLKPEIAPDAAWAITADSVERQPSDIIKENLEILQGERDRIYNEIFDLKRQVLEVVSLPESEENTQGRLKLEREISEKNAIAGQKTQEIMILLTNILIYPGPYKMQEQGPAAAGGVG